MRIRTVSTIYRQTPDERALLAQLAEAQGLTLSDLLRRLVMEQTEVHDAGSVDRELVAVNAS